ncbi:helix-turn-helix domain-containing protein [Bacillus licheniformis]|uniref:Helix-turn-helix domain-containing protein n=1 Tax=Bacillus swezeyi TaxID=1925020 RepID=A0A5M8RTG3_9BACI|nr:MULTISPECIES: helix-turn-helix domain-containing protein [Bacillus]KAA6450386.1 helix-turn-helix domain-containing protein [Bacillus swezeyi]KJH55775.1 DNA-binding protein [Bacillus licheniformis]MCQ5302479.1 helix-turn-helix domain-containing protein [Bacillus licheniformis]MCY7774905.1 helix-turn-helix domain-containing protein [Bacillus licheniformis]MCY7789827.1 helix-turn-helix domain-containing protein [Bacillus haynesii]
MTRNTLNVQEAADYLGVHHDTIYAMVRENQIPHFRVRKRIFFTRASIDAWINAQENKIIVEACESL